MYTNLESEEYYDNISDLFKTNDTYQCYLFGDIDNTHKILSNFIKCKDSVVLDLGCGIGSFIKYLNENGFKNTTGVVNSQKLKDISKERFNLNIIKDDMILFMSKNKNKFDVIFNIESVGYVNIDNYFKEAYNCLNDNGIVVLKDFSAISDPGDVGKDWGNYTFYNHMDIINAAHKYNFKILVVHKIKNGTTTSEHFKLSLNKINHKYTDSSTYKSVNVITFVIYVFQKC